MGKLLSQTNTNPNNREPPSKIKNVYLVPSKTLQSHFKLRILIRVTKGQYLKDLIKRYIFVVVLLKAAKAVTKPFKPKTLL